MCTVMQQESWSEMERDALTGRRHQLFENNSRNVKCPQPAGYFQNIINDLLFMERFQREQNELTLMIGVI